MTKLELLKLLSERGNRYGDLILECLIKYDRNNTQELTVEELAEFAKEKGFIK